MKQNQKFWSLIAISAAWSTVAFAQSTTTSSSTPAAPSSTSVAEVKTEESSGFKLPVRLSYGVDVFGPRLTNPSDNWTATDAMSDQNDIASQDPILLRHNAAIGRDVGAGINLSAHAYFNTFMTDPANNGKTKGLKWRDSYVQASKGDLAAMTINGSELTLGGDLRYYAPTSTTSRLNNNRGQVRMTVMPNLQFGKSIFSLATVSYLKFWMHSQRLASGEDGRATGAPMNEWEVYTGPQLTAQLTDSVAVWALYEALLQRDTAGNLTNAAPYSGKALTDLEPGATFNIGKHFSISPFLNWYTALPVSTTSMNVSLSASI